MKPVARLKARAGATAVAGLLPVFFAAVVATLGGCTETYDAGSNSPHGLLPVDERNPIIIFNDSQYDNWQGEYALLMANHGGPELIGIVVNTGTNANNIDDNFADRQKLIAAAQKSGMRKIPPLIKSIGPALIRPKGGDLDATVPNGSEGANFILKESSRVALPYRPLVLVVGGRLTDVADAYLLDPTVTDRVVVVASLGSLTATGAVMGPPNGEMDPWADSIVTARFRLVQISAYYDQTADVPASRLSDVPDNAFGDWITTRQPQIWNLPAAADQEGVAAVGIPGVVVTVERASAGPPVAAGANTGPTITNDLKGKLWLVREVSGSLLAAHFWSMLVDPKTYLP